jgi:hypothetical protein
MARAAGRLTPAPARSFSGTLPALEEEVIAVWALDQDDRVIARAVWARLRPSGKTPG